MNTTKQRIHQRRSAAEFELNRANDLLAQIQRLADDATITHANEIRRFGEQAPILQNLASRRAQCEAVLSKSEKDLAHYDALCVDVDTLEVKIERLDYLRGECTRAHCSEAAKALAPQFVAVEAALAEAIEAATRIVEERAALAREGQALAAELGEPIEGFVAPTLSTLGALVSLGVREVALASGRVTSPGTYWITWTADPVEAFKGAAPALGYGDLLLQYTGAFQELRGNPPKLLELTREGTLAEHVATRNREIEAENAAANAKTKEAYERRLAAAQSEGRAYGH